jgi:uncharacterized protein YukE
MRDRLLLEEIRALSGRIDALASSVNGRIDSVNARLDTLIDSLAELRREFDRHTHE